MPPARRRLPWLADQRRRRGLASAGRHPAKVLPGGGAEIAAEDLHREALVFVYRLLFCFYAEARGGELGIVPIDNECYRLGYSVESLRDLEQVPLTAATEEGQYFNQHITGLGLFFPDISSVFFAINQICS